MKYLKITLGLFAVSCILSSFNVQAKVKNLVDITIPVFSGKAIIKDSKATTNLQYITKTKCTDDISGDGRVIDAGLHLTTDSGNPQYDPAWVEAKPNVKVAFNNNSKQMGSWNLYLKSRKNLITSASFWGTWTID